MKIKYTENSFLHIKAFEIWSIGWAVRTAAPVGKSVTDASPYSQSKFKISSDAAPDLGLGIQCLFDPWIRDLGFKTGPGMGKKSGLGSGIRFQDEKPRSYFWELRNHFFGLKYLNPLIRIWWWKKFRSGIWDGKILELGSEICDGKNSDSGSSFRDKLSGSAKLEILLPNLLGLKESNNNQTLCGKGTLGWDQVLFTI